MTLYLNESEFSRQISPLFFSFLGIKYKELSFLSDEDFQEKVGNDNKVPFPFLPLLKAEEKWVAGDRAICEYAILISGKLDLSGKNFEDEVKLQSILSQCETVITKLLYLEKTRSLPDNDKLSVIELEIDPILQSFDCFIRGKKGFLDYATIPDFYLYVALLQLNGIYDNTYNNYFWLQKFKIGMDIFLAEKMAGSFLSPAIKSIKKEIEHDWKMENSEILIDGKIPFEKNRQSVMNEIEFLRDIDHIPESITKSIRMVGSMKNSHKNNFS